MLSDLPLIAVIPVRGGSKGVPGKNLYSFLGLSLLERTIRFAQKSPRIDEVYVTTDDPIMNSIALDCGAKTPGLRPDFLSNDTARSIDAVIHLLNHANLKTGYVCLLQVTSPLRTLSDLELACTYFESVTIADSLVSVTRHNDPHPYKLLSLNDRYIKSFLGNDPSTPRQLLPEVYAINGLFYLSSIDLLQNKRIFIGENCLHFEIESLRSTNIDTHLDIITLEALVGSKAVLPEYY